MPRRIEVTREEMERREENPTPERQAEIKARKKAIKARCKADFEAKAEADRKAAANAAKRRRKAHKAAKRAARIANVEKIDVTYRPVSTRKVRAWREKQFYNPANAEPEPDALRRAREIVAAMRGE